MHVAAWFAQRDAIPGSTSTRTPLTHMHLSVEPHPGMTAMHVAAWFAQRDAIEYLLAKRASLNKENAYGVPPIGLTRPGPIKRLM